MNIGFVVPSRYPTAVRTRSAWPPPKPVKHARLETVSHDVVLHTVFPRTPDGVVSDKNPKLIPSSVKENEADDGIF